ncbi:MAG: ATP-dependent DNA helicase, partial [Acidimicrobiales bacterium]
TDAPAVPFPAIDTAIAAKEHALGRALTAGQTNAVIALATSGRGANVVVGLAGSGKTTVLDVARAAFEAAGYRVLGTSTSGQAARTLGREAGMESRTMASLLWRLDHDRLRLDARTVVICDEAGMADDPSVLRLAAAAEAAGAKVVLVGDHRQLGAVGPGGTLEALVARHPDAVHTLDENVRQTDPAERAALVELRSGDVGAALAFYAERDRIRPAATRDEALDAMVERWAADVEAGADTAMFAWRRANVAELNARGRAAMAEQLSGPELVTGGRCFQAGDRIVTLAPGANGEVVTSERGVVEVVMGDEGALIARMDDGRRQAFTGNDLGPDRLAHGYAVTVHRSQGATVDTAHCLADGGGRELGYVAMSRARGTSHAYVVADDVDSAVEDLARDWSCERRQLWAIDSGTPATSPLDVEAHAGA